MSSIDDGKSFEGEVAHLLALADFEVEREVLVGYKKIDLYILQRTLGSRRRLAVECKAHGRRLTQSQVNLIYSNYKPLIDSNQVDGVLLVTRNGLAPSALTMVKTIREMSHMTSADLFDLVMDFGPYLAGIQRQFDDQGLSSYYIPPRTPGGQSLEEAITAWIENAETGPMAILGSYGTGKTTLAKRMASVLATQAREKAESRIPILVRLGEISSEQSLEGLLGKLFTAHTVVKNYTFELFMSLNKMGRFVIFLDGFDEMKHALSWTEFKYNFRQLNRLVSKNSKVIILGRPTAFLNDDEYRFALRGIRTLGRFDFREPDWPEYEEFHLSPFSEEQARLFIKRYLSYKLETTTSLEEKRKIRSVIENKVDKIFERKFSDLARRPVQLKILAEILPSWKSSIEELTVSKLYSYFIDLIIEREQDKIARRKFGVAARRSFARDLAIFLWVNRGEMSITADSIPRELIDKHVRDGDDFEAIKRDLVSACFLDRKLGDSLFFPHRSFQEFLVGEALVADLSSGEMRFPAASKLANDEIVDFMEGMISLETLQRWEGRFERSQGTISTRFAEMWFSQEGAVSYLWGRFERSDSPWYPALLTLAVLDGRLQSKRARLASMVLDRISGPVGRSALVYLWCSLKLAKSGDIGRAFRRVTKVESYLPPDAARPGFTPEYGVTQVFSKVELGPAGSNDIFLANAFPVLFESLVEYCCIGEGADGYTSFARGLPTVVTLSREEFVEVEDFRYKYCGKRRQKKLPIIEPANPDILGT
jgi:hypothetical protein